MFKRLVNAVVKRLIFAYEQSKLDILYKNPKVIIQPGLRVEEYFSANLPHDNYTITIGKNVHFKKYCHLMVFNKGKLIIGSDVFFNNYCSINCLENITIGDNTQFGEGVKIYDHNHKYGYINDTLFIEKSVFNTAPVIIGANCWIGSSVTILRGVTIGDNTIIGANNLIHRSVPANTIIKAKADYIIKSDRN